MRLLDTTSRTTTHDCNMAGVRSIWRATGMKHGGFDKSIAGGVQLKDLGQPAIPEALHAPYGDEADLREIDVI